MSMKTKGHCRLIGDYELDNQSTKSILRLKSIEHPGTWTFRIRAIYVGNTPPVEPVTYRIWRRYPEQSKKTRGYLLTSGLMNRRNHLNDWTVGGLMTAHDMGEGSRITIQIDHPDFGFGIGFAIKRACTGSPARDGAGE